MRLHIVTVIAVDGDHRCLTQRFRKIFKGFEKMLFEFLHLLDWRVSSSRSLSGPRPARPSRAGVTLLRVSLLGVTLRPVCLVTVTDVDALRDLLRLSVEGLGGLDCELMTMMLPPLGPICPYLGLPTQVQDLLALLLQLTITFN